MWLWVKNRYHKWNPVKWKEGLKPAVFGGLILTHTHVHNNEGGLSNLHFLGFSLQLAGDQKKKKRKKKKKTPSASASRDAGQCPQ